MRPLVTRAAPVIAGALLLLVVYGGLASCGWTQQSNGRNDQYRPVYGSRDDRASENRGTVRGDFQWAATAPTLPVAASRWEEFLKTHGPPGREFEDSVHASYVAAAQYELIRVYYLQGRRDEGDALLRRVDPVGWMK
jgi:hypothetical protein